ncbi:hypothetical protein H6G80_30275 [Nostoc sp. FACHB-87]|uniref:hypothetical protein n=1 Tax=Nostocaceae TaxID=1162 RepID=UPI00168897D7|nr:MULTISPECIES: hypothetical protein [Nostocaceae]MBD2458341.1 hypothetical protein [Nostoc sp. FACHB-87]MBD2479348.1 hypothetical protein [Anabaena sp. FACHB-83]
MNSLERNPVLIRRILITISISWMISSTAVIVAYSLASSTVWKGAFGENGAIFELVRSLIIALGTATTLLQVFPNETHEFIQLRQRKSVALKWIRLVALVVVIAIICCMIWHHFYYGPEFLANPPKVSPPQMPPDWYKLTEPRLHRGEVGYFERYQLPYLWYFPYSFVNIICFGAPALTVGLYASVKKLVAVHKAKGNLLIAFQNANLNPDTKEIYRQFELFCINFIEIFSSYSVLCLILAVLVAFEYRIAYKTQSLYGVLWTWFGYTLAFSDLLAIFLAFSYYEDAFQQGSRQLVEMGEDVSEFESKNGVLRILNRILIRHLSLYVTLGIILATFTFLSPLLRLLGLSA